MSVKTFRERLKIEVIREPLLTSSCIMSVFISIESSRLVPQGICLHLLGLECFVRHFLKEGVCLDSRGCHIWRGHTKVTSSQHRETNKTRHTKLHKIFLTKGCKPLISSYETRHWGVSVYVATKYSTY